MKHKFILTILLILFSVSANAQTAGNFSFLKVAQYVIFDSVGVLPAPLGDSVKLFGRGNLGYFIRYADGTVHNLDSTGSGTGTTDHAALSNLSYAAAGHTGFQPTIAAGTYLTPTDSTDTHNWAAQQLALKEPAITAGTTAQYLRGDKSLGTLNQAAVDGLTTASSPSFTGLSLTGTSGNILACETSGLVYDATNNRVGVGTASPSYTLHTTAPDNSTYGIYASLTSNITGAAAIYGSFIAGATSGSVYTPAAISGVAEQVNASSSVELVGIHVISRTPIGGSGNYTGTLYGMRFSTQHRGTGTLSALTGCYAQTYIGSTGGVTAGIAYNAFPWSISGIFTTWTGLNIGAPVFSGGGGATNLRGISISDYTAGTNNTLFGIGTLTTGNWGLYINSTKDNYFAGAMQFIGNITKINNVTTSFPSSQGSANTFLKNDGAGTLTWSTIAQANVSGLTTGSDVVHNSLSIPEGQAYAFTAGAYTGYLYNNTLTASRYWYMPNRSGTTEVYIYNAASTGATAMAFGTYTTVKVTPNANATYTTTVSAAGVSAYLIILTSGTSSYTITFGTGFKTTGTLATGTVDAKTFVLHFISDGTSMIEVSRTTAM